ncbi:MAG: glycosyltransferase [Bacteroidota bacterium]
MRPRLLIIGSFRFYSIERHFAEFLGEEAFEVSRFDAQERFYGYYNKSIVNKIIFKMGWSGIYQSINKSLLEEFDAVRPDAVLVFKGMELFPETIDKMRSGGAVVINYNPDNPFLFSGKGSGNANITENLPKYDGHVTYDRDILERLSKEVKGKLLLLPFGYRYTENDYAKAVAAPEIARVCFVANADKHRAEFITRLADHVPVDVYGSWWKDFVNHKNVKAYPPVLAEEFWITLRKYRVQLNLMRPHNPGSHNMRTFEVPGIGGILLAPDTIDHREYFTDGETIFLFDGVEACAGKVNQILNMSDEEVREFRERTQQWCVSQGYSYKDRAQQLGNFITSLLNEKNGAS